MRSITTGVSFPPQGRPGVPGPPGDYGYIRYDEVTGLPAMALEPGVLSAFVVSPPTIVDSRLRGPFTDHVFLDANGILRARKAGDAYDVRVRLAVVAGIAGGRFEVMVFITNNTSGIIGANAVRKVDLSEQAGDEEIVDMSLELFPAAGFVANGARIMVRCSVPATTNRETLFVTPKVAAA